MRFGVYWRCLAAYLSGWVIANAVFNRVRKHWQKTDEAEKFKREVADYVGEALIAKLESRDRELEALRNLYRIVKGVLNELDVESPRGKRDPEPVAWRARLKNAHDRVSLLAVLGPTAPRA